MTDKIVHIDVSRIKAPEPSSHAFAGAHPAHDTPNDGPSPTISVRAPVRKVFRGSRTHCDTSPSCHETGICHAAADPSQCGITIVDVEPDAPPGEEVVDYRGWEASYDGQGAYAAVFGDGRWVAYKGGCDLGASEVSSSTWSGLLDEIDAAED